MRLNLQQQQAIEYVNGPCLVLAGAGSGKTRVIINKIAHLIRHCELLPKQIVAVTFTNKAAREMKERVVHFIPKDQRKGLAISTFHTLGLSILKREYRHLGFRSQLTLFDQHDQMALLKELSPLNVKENKDWLNQAANTISNWKGHLLLPQTLLEQTTHSEQHAMVLLYQAYQQQLQAYNVLDFDDLILLPTLLLRSNEVVRHQWQQRIRYLLVDEYQDTNLSQYELIKLLVGEQGNFTVVGDDDQSIYSWRGARPKNMQYLRDDFPQLKVIKLEQNYRSTQRILHASNILIQNNDHVFEKKLFSTLGQGEKIKVLEAENETHEAERIVGEIIGQRFMFQRQYRDFAILYRGNYQSRLFEKLLMQNRIPYKITGGTSFFSRPEIKDMLAYLRLVVNHEDDAAFLRIINTPRREIGVVTLEKLGWVAKQKQVSLFDAIFELELMDYVTPKAYTALQNFAHWIVDLNEQIKRSEPTQVVKHMLQHLDYEAYLYEHATSPKAAEMQAMNVATLFEWVASLLQGDENNPAMTLDQTVSHLILRDMLEKSASEENSDQVQLMTLHASKGLEFPYVFLVGMEEGILPHQTSIDENNVDEERRLAYVGMTRAQKELTFSLCKERTQYGQSITPEPSRFLFELPSEDLDWGRTNPPLTQTQQDEKILLGLAQMKANLQALKNRRG